MSGSGEAEAVWWKAWVETDRRHCRSVKVDIYHVQDQIRGAKPELLLPLKQLPVRREMAAAVILNVKIEAEVK